MPDPRPPRAVDLAHDATRRAGQALADLAEVIEPLDPEEAAEVLYGLVLPPGPAHALAGILNRFGHWAAEGWDNPRIYEPLIREAAELTLGAYRVTTVANQIANLGETLAGSRSAAALATSPAAQAAEPRSVLRSPSSPVPAAVVVPQGRIVEPPRR
ncbi:hypothetical protein ACFVVU_30660 [Kitasatospora sp. NPDC057965]|uniref:hypothetical protein n=1 Tax=Kitasatospora sp. NPDC057965 TaxID=3346291 RepID=UPI0036D8474E